MQLRVNSRILFVYAKKEKCGEVECLRSKEKVIVRQVG